MRLYDWAAVGRRYRGLFTDYPFRLKALIIVDLVWSAQAVIFNIFLLYLGIPFHTLYPLQTLNTIFMIAVSLVLIIWQTRVRDTMRRRESERAMRDTQSDLIQLINRLKNEKGDN